MRSRVLFLFCLLVFAFLPQGIGDALTIKGKSDICLSESVVIDKGKATVREGSKTSDQYIACTSGIRNFENCGKVSFTGPATRTNPTGRPCEAISKCKSDFQNRLSSCMQALGLESTDEIDLSDPAATRDYVEGLDSSTDEGREQLARVLQDMGISDITPVHVSENPGTAKELAFRILDGDEAGAAAAARTLGLNDDLRDVSYLQPGSKYDKDLDRTIDELVQKYGGTTFDSGPKSGGCDLDKAQQVIKYMESNGRYGINTNAGGGRVVHGAYQMLTDNVRRWSCEIGKCANAAQFLRNAALQDEIFRHKFEQYKRARGSYTVAAGMWHGGPGFNPNRSDVLGTKTGSYMAKFARLCGDASFSFNKNDYTQYGGDPYYGSLTGQSSPFANTNPFVSASQPPPQQYPQQQAPRPPVTPVSSQILPQQTGGGSLPPAPVQPAASLIAQPKEVKRGNPLVVSWSTVGMSTANPCQIYLQAGGTTSLFVRGNEGSRTFTTSATSTLGTWEFKLQCSSPTGAAFERSASVVVK